METKKNVLNTCRKSYFAVILSLLMLFVSCQQYDSDRIQRSFDYTEYESFNGFLVTDFSNLNSGKGSYEGILSVINEAYGTNIAFPYEELTLTNKSLEEIQIEFLEKGYLTQQSLELANVILENLQQNNFNMALTAFETAVLDLNLSDEEFIKYNTVANVFKITNKTDPNIFDFTTTSRCGENSFWCVVAVVNLGVSIGLLAGCATIIACAPILANFVLAVRGVDQECAPCKQNTK